MSQLIKTSSESEEELHLRHGTASLLCLSHGICPIFPTPSLQIVFFMSTIDMATSVLLCHFSIVLLKKWARIKFLTLERVSNWPSLFPGSSGVLRSNEQQPLLKKGQDAGLSSSARSTGGDKAGKLTNINDSPSKDTRKMWQGQRKERKGATVYKTPNIKDLKIKF